MSESEKKRRLLYRKRRRRNIILQVSVIALVALIAAASLLLYFRIDQKIYVNYTEKGNVDYSVMLKNNSFYDEPVLGPNQAYVAETIDKIPFAFNYEMALDADKVEYQYSYSVNTRMEIIDNKTMKPLISKTEVLKESGTLKKIDSPLKIAETAMIDYQAYNKFAKDFIDTHTLPNHSASLTVYMTVNVITMCNDLESDSVNSYTVSASIPLAQTTLDVAVSTTVPPAETRMLACSNTWVQNVFKVVAIVSASVLVALVILLILYTYLTRNHDIVYSTKIKRLYASYKSYIQKITDAFDATGYRLVEVDSFEAMLNIRDTLQAPILMHENLDNTRTVFVIPAGELLYSFDIKVEDYDELYAPMVTEEDVAESLSAEEPTAVTEELVREVVNEMVDAKCAKCEETPKATATPIVVKVTSKKKPRKPWALLAGAAIFVGSAVAGFRSQSKKD